MSAKIQVSRDTVIAIALVLVVSFGFNLYQRFLYTELSQENLDLIWSTQNDKADLVYVRGLLKRCKQNAAEQTLDTGAASD